MAKKKEKGYSKVQTSKVYKLEVVRGQEGKWIGEQLSKLPLGALLDGTVHERTQEGICTTKDKWTLFFSAEVKEEDV